MTLASVVSHHGQLDPGLAGLVDLGAQLAALRGATLATLGSAWRPRGPFAAEMDESWWVHGCY